MITNVPSLGNPVLLNDKFCPCVIAISALVACYIGNASGVSVTTFVLHISLCDDGFLRAPSQANIFRQ